MQHTGIKIFLIVLGFLWVPTVSLSLPNCPSDQTKRYHNCVGTYTYDDGSKYVGEWKDDKQHGQGTFTWPGGDTYIGEYKDGKKNGYGTSTFASGNRHVGEYKDGVRNGQGFFVWKDGRADLCFYTDDEDSNCSGTNVYDVALNLTEKFRQMPEFQRKKIQSNLKLNGFYTSVVDGKWGRGTFTALASHAAVKLKTVNINTASSANNLLQNVLGTGSSSDNSCPTDPNAIWHNCVGTYTYDGGDKYVGEWKNNKKHGQGTYTSQAGSSYIGEYKNGKKHGQGTYTYPDGSIYVGQLENGDFNGQGSLTLANGDTYVGKFKDDDANGQGSLTLANGDTYVGEFKDNNFNGQGTFTFGPNSEWSGDKYVGEFKNDKQHGQGTYIFADGSRKTGLWESGEFQGAVTSPEVVENVNPNETREVASGTGFYVSEDGHIITNHHVIDGCMDIKVQSQGELIPTIRLAEDKQNDLALLKVSQEPRYVFALSNDSPYPLQEIVVAGFPFGDRYSSTLKFTKGIVSSLAGLGDNYSEIQIDAALQQGNSGGPIIDEYGNVVAVAVAKLDAKYMFENFGIIPENTNFGVKASAARNLLEANRVDLKASSNEIISKRDLSSIAADGTVYLTCWMTNAQLEQMKSKKVMFQDLD
ncbi:trypsin-like peptidase domain-containing protein [Planktomarina temperata]|nr:trypsin-like peptidase domain-containing protein [Planktomarina temperata]